MEDSSGTDAGHIWQADENQGKGSRGEGDERSVCTNDNVFYKK